MLGPESEFDKFQPRGIDRSYPLEGQILHLISPDFPSPAAHFYSWGLMLKLQTNQKHLTRPQLYKQRNKGCTADGLMRIVTNTYENIGVSGGISHMGRRTILKFPRERVKDVRTLIVNPVRTNTSTIQLYIDNRLIVKSTAVELA